MLYFTTENTIADLFTTWNLVAYFLMSVINAVLLLLASYKFLQIMQQSGYEGIGYFKWLRRRDNVYLNRLATVSMLSILGFLLTNIAFAFVDKAWIFYIGFIFYVVLLLNYFRADKKRKKKIPIVYTARMNRLIVTYFAFLFIISFALIVGLNVFAFYFSENSLLVRIRLAPICLMPLFIPVFVLVGYYITKPYELHVQKKYVNLCINRLKERNDLIKIGITGSYGKTSIKRFLTTILEEKYSVLATPSSYNTPMGICKTVKYLKSTHQVFIAEMGARRIGDIGKLAKIVEPDYAIISGITNQHLETFGTLNAIKQTKYELVESMSSGTVVYTVDNEETTELFSDCKIKSIPAGLNLFLKPEVYAKNIAVDHDGTRFTLVVHSEEIECKTQLLGRHNVSNLCISAAIAYEIGLSLPEISAGISRVTPVEHRLSVTKNDRGIIIIDDSYNSNPVGFDAAMEVLNLFKGRKIVITPGMVEMGFAEDMENYRLGKKLASSCDIAVLVGRIAALIIKSAMVENGFDPEKIIYANTLDAAMKKLNEIIKEGDVILFENDLPDKFS